MLLNTKFSLNDRVKIKELEKDGRVVAIYLSDENIQYSVRYFDGFTPHTCYFYQDEICFLRNKENLGFKTEKV